MLGARPKDPRTCRRGPTPRGAPSRRCQVVSKISHAWCSPKLLSTGARNLVPLMATWARRVLKQHRYPCPRHQEFGKFRARWGAPRAKARPTRWWNGQTTQMRKPRRPRADARPQESWILPKVAISKDAPSRLQTRPTESVFLRAPRLSAERACLLNAMPPPRSGRVPNVANVQPQPSRQRCCGRQSPQQSRPPRPKHCSCSSWQQMAGA